MKKHSVRKILVPIDFSEMSVSALETAKRLAQRFEETIDVVHVYGFNYPVGFIAAAPPLMPYSIVTYDERAERKVVERLRAFAAQYDFPNEACHVASGAPVFDEICRLARELTTDLIVLPTHGYSGLKHVFLGSTAERVVQHASCPVFIVRSDEEQEGKKRRHGINRILVPVDFSDRSLEGLTCAIEYAKKFAARIIVIHAVYLGCSYTREDYAMYDLSVFIERARRDAERQMREFIRAAKFGGVKFETEIKVGHPLTEICAFAKNQDVDLIITSTHGRTGFAHALIGSVAEQVVRHACRPVVVVPSHPRRRLSRLAEAKPTRTSYPAKISLKQIGGKAPNKRSRKLTAHAFPERRKTNKFRSLHSNAA
jgi:nucleotide-binding universal stress UspA family protein